jgi:outer membrane protein assembly factor BamB
VTVRQGSVYCSSNLGFVARCDARDGAIEWISCYTRALCTDSNGARIFARQGCAPILAGDKLLVMPRDYQGIFALDSRTGKVLWDNAIAPTQEFVGLGGAGGQQSAIVKDTNRLAAIDVESGKRVWQDLFENGLHATPQIVGDSIYALSGQKLTRLCASSGCVRDEAQLAPEDGVYSFAMHGSEMTAIGEGSVAGGAAALNASAPASSGGVGLPLCKTWELRRPMPQLIVPPPEAFPDEKAPDKVLLRSQDMLECVSVTPQGAVDWRITLPPGLVEMQWAPRTLCLATADRVVCLDAASGKVRWESTPGFRINQCKVLGSCIFAGSHSPQGDKGRDTAAIDLASGKVLWHKRWVPELGPPWEDSFRLMASDGKNLQLLAQPFGRAAISQLTVRPDNGQLVAAGSFMGGSGAPYAQISAGEGFGFYLDAQGRVYDFSLAGGGRPIPAGSPMPANVEIEQFQVEGQWLHATYMPAYYTQATAIFRHNDPSYLYVTPCPSVIRGDRLFELDTALAPGKAECSLAITDLPTRKRQVYKLSPAAAGANMLEIAGFWETADKLYVVVCDDENNYTRNPNMIGLRVECFDKASCSHLATGPLDDLVYFKAVMSTGLWYTRLFNKTDIQMVNGVVLVTDLYGLHAYTASAAAAAPEAREMSVPFVADRKIGADGSKGDFTTDGQAIKTASGAEARVFVSHDAANLHLAVTVGADGMQPFAGDADVLWGDHLELCLKLGQYFHRAVLGIDASGRRRFDFLPADETYKGAQVEIEPDVINQTITYEISIPLKSVIFDMYGGGRAPVVAMLSGWGSTAGNSGSLFQWRRKLNDLESPSGKTAKQGK